MANHTGEEVLRQRTHEPLRERAPHHLGASSLLPSSPSRGWRAPRTRPPPCPSTYSGITFRGPWVHRPGVRWFPAHVAFQSVRGGPSPEITRNMPWRARRD